jgi:quinol monooxygenase YgiN
MPVPIVFISHFTIREGSLEAFRKQQRKAVEHLRTAKPRTLAFLTYLDEEASRLSIVHVFGDPESLDVHFEGAMERARAAYEHLLPAGWEVYGTPSEAAMGMLRSGASAAGVTVEISPGYAGGFLRVSPS